MCMMKIVLAEDDSDDKFFFVYFLEDRQDIAILNCVENGLEVLEFLNALADDDDLPDMILLDQNMPKMNGLETLKLLKINSRYSHIPVFVYSTYADLNLTDNCLAAGAVRVYQKPTNKDSYNLMIDSLIETINSSK